MKKSVIFRVDEDLHKKLKIYLLVRGTTIQEFFEEYTKKLLDKPQNNLKS